MRRFFIQNLVNSGGNNLWNYKLQEIQCPFQQTDRYRRKGKDGCDENSAEPKRDKKELEAILKDLKLIQKLLDEDISKQDLSPFPIGFITKKQKTAWEQKQTNKVKALVENGKLSTCEGVGLVELMLEKTENIYSMANFFQGYNYIDSEEALIFLDESYSIADLVSDVEQAVGGKISKLESDRIKSVLDLCKSYVDCDSPKAFTPSLLKEAKNLAFDPDNVAISVEEHSVKKSLIKETCII